MTQPLQQSIDWQIEYALKDAKAIIKELCDSYCIPTPLATFERIDKAIAATQVVADQPIATIDWIKISEFAAEYASEYEYDDGCIRHTPTSEQRHYLDDCIAGLVNDDDFRALLASNAGKDGRTFDESFPDSAGKASSDQIAQSIKYPDDWDTAAYPTIESALIEIYAWFSIRSSEPAVAAIEAVKS